MPAPTPLRLFFSGVLVAVVLFLRPPTTNFIFDEQEALLGNPFLNGDTAFYEAFLVDFWGREPARTIGSYRPVPNLLWWPLAASLQLRTPWVFCWLNLLLHAGAVTLFASSVRAIVSRAELPQAVARLTVWGSAAFLVTCATSTEALCSAVGLADVLVGVLCLAALWLCAVPLPVVAMRGSAGVLVGGASFSLLVLGLFSKETMIAGVVLLPLLVWVFMPGSLTRGRKIILLGSVSAGCLLALGCFVLVRASLFSGKPAEMAPLLLGGAEAPLASFFAWFAQPTMPVDPYNNPLLSAGPSERLATSFGLFARQLGQIVLPWGLSGDYSYPRELPVFWGFVPVFGVILALFGAGLALRFLVGVAPEPRRASGLLSGVGALWILISYVPISNSLVLLPTIRGDRLLYPITIGVALIVAAVLSTLASVSRRPFLIGLTALLLFQAAQARRHAMSFSNDVAFWRAASQSPRASAKAVLNYGVMLGARGDESARLVHTQAAVRRAPEWAMGRIYLADTYCRLGQLDDAWPHYRKGFSDAPNSKALTALGVQCLWDAGVFGARRGELSDLAAAHPDTWLAFFVDQVAERGAQNSGIPPQYRPRRYNAPPPETN